ncbi:MAG: hypothetical protein KAH23_07535, partial [Kiritimatiellae bacterium]|nr:hypothetical protein [Kiritimatiellia bacterium]
PLFVLDEFDDLVLLSRAYLTANKADMGVFECNVSRCRGFDRKTVIPEPLLDGDEIIKAGCKRGPAVGKILKELLELQLEEEITTRDMACQWLSRQIKHIRKGG